MRVEKALGGEYVFGMLLTTRRKYARRVIEGSMLAVELCVVFLLAAVINSGMNPGNDRKCRCRPKDPKRLYSKKVLTAVLV